MVVMVVMVVICETLPKTSYIRASLLGVVKATTYARATLRWYGRVRRYLNERKVIA